MDARFFWIKNENKMTAGQRLWQWAQGPRPAKKAGRQAIGPKGPYSIVKYF